MGVNNGSAAFFSIKREVKNQPKSLVLKPDLKSQPPCQPDSNFSLNRHAVSFVNLYMNDRLPADFIEYAWTTFLLVWAISALKVKVSVKRQSIASRLQQSLPVITAFCLVFAPS